MLCSHVPRVMEILHLEEIPAKHIVKRCTKDARDILSQHRAQYQRDNSANMSFTCRHSKLYLKAMEVVRMDDASTTAYDHLYEGLDALLVSGAPLAEKRVGLGLHDRMAGLTPGTLLGNDEIAYLGGDGAEKCISTGNSVNVNGLHGLKAPDKQRGVGRSTNSREKASYEGLSRRNRFCSICRCEGHKQTTCPERRDALKKPRKPGRCKNCGMEGHRRTTCTRPLDVTEK
ncbi:hypothetical protein VPH35_000922 [Triticum aestivum]|uniref:uncharacterized protein n=1 Tax=Triticum aestivum TaxID=4565 RepID=UPI0008454B89|nr:uncharacterized protein LOC123091269 [Triticum aestivum]